ncbi:MAG TPA: hypothetical protein DDZ80_12180, partial [Cyanobacteria bacterium UBA8803]|nr:hypothetical protein [Cyanobacteria bacterium UBA8803]
MAIREHWLEIAQYISLAGSTLGTVVAAVTQQVVYAAAPLSLTIGLNLVNQQRLNQLHRKQTNAAIAQLHQHLDPLTQRLTQLESLRSDRDRQIAELQNAIAQLQITLEQNSPPNPPNL